MVFIYKKYWDRCGLIKNEKGEHMPKQKTVTKETYNLIIDLYGEEHCYVSELNRYSDASNYFDGVQFETIVAILNPRTQKWAFENLVEKEKRYIWTAKKKDNDGETFSLIRGFYGLIILNCIKPAAELTESEICEWGYNPDMFDKEEVE